MLYNKTPICTGVVWLALSAAIALNYYLALIAIWNLLHLMQAYYIEYTTHAQKTYKTYPE